MSNVIWLPRQGVQSPASKIFKSYPDMVLSSLLWVVLELDEMIPRRPFQAQPFHDSVISEMATVDSASDFARVSKSGEQLMAGEGHRDMSSFTLVFSDVHFKEAS